MDINHLRTLNTYLVDCTHSLIHFECRFFDRKPQQSVVDAFRGNLQIRCDLKGGGGLTEKGAKIKRMYV